MYVITVFTHAMGSPWPPSMPYATSVAKSCSVSISYGFFYRDLLVRFATYLNKNVECYGLNFGL
jgi:hypothetical protein